MLEKWGIWLIENIETLRMKIFKSWQILLNHFKNGTLEDVKGFCAVADLQEIEKQDFILTPGRYVGIEEVEDDGEPFEDKMKRLTSELSDMFAKSHELEDEIRKKLGAIGYEV